MSCEQASSTSRLLGAILMVSGCCIGAGMLGLPLVTASAGFAPTAILFFISWLFMASTGLLLLEVNLWFGPEVNLLTMAEAILGKTAKYIVSFLFLFLFYCLMVAYLAAGGGLLLDFISNLFGVEAPRYTGSVILSLLLGLILFAGSRSVDMVNRVLMFCLGVTYVTLVELGMLNMEWENLVTSNWRYALPALPAMVISFGYHNLVPSLTTYLRGHVLYLKIAILVGSLIPLLVYLIWDGVILGILPSQGVQESIDQGAMVTKLLRETVGGSMIVTVLEYFSFFALITSFITVGLSFNDFLADGLHVKKGPLGSLLLVLLVLFPPFMFASLNPLIFLSALNYAGAFGAVILFGIIPVLMVWRGRYHEKQPGVKLVPGGRPALLLIGAFALMIFFMQLKSELLG